MHGSGGLSPGSRSPRTTLTGQIVVDGGNGEVKELSIDIDPMFVRTRSASPVLQHQESDDDDDRVWFRPNVPSKRVDGGDAFADDNIPVFFEHDRIQFEWKHVRLDKMVFHIVNTFNAGYLNAVAYATPEAFPVAHVTGHVTNVTNTNLPLERNEQHLYLVLFFLLGSMVAGLFNTDTDETPAPRYGLMLGFANLMIIVALIVDVTCDAHHAFLYLLAMSCGFQNSLFSIYSGHAYRTTHMTGTTTDIGIVLARTMSVGYYKDSKKLFQLVPSLFAYFLGGVAGFRAYVKWERSSIVVIIILMFLVSVYLALWPTVKERFCSGDEDDQPGVETVKMAVKESTQRHDGSPSKSPKSSLNVDTGIGMSPRRASAPNLNILDPGIKRIPSSQGGAQ